MKTLYIHIGTAKTGTSAIQRFLEGNAALLYEKGMCQVIVGRSPLCMPYYPPGPATAKRIACEGLSVLP